MERAAKSGRNIKAMGTKYAFSDVTFTYGWLIGCSKYLRRIDMKLDADMLTEAAADKYRDGYLLKCEAGVTYEVSTSTSAHVSLRFVNFEELAASKYNDVLL